MKVSVVIPTYYRSDDLAQLFDSLLNQTDKPLDIIVVDDTPTTAIKVVCEEWIIKFKNVGIDLFYIKNPRERSVTIARNVGAEMSQGDVFLFLDSDVILFPLYIREILEVFKKYPNALAVQGWIVGFRKMKFYYSWQTLKKLFFLSHHSKDSCKYGEWPTLLTDTINCEWLTGCNMAVKREVFGEFHFDESLRKFTYLDDALVSYLIFKKYPDGLFLTPHAKCIHKTGEVERRGNRALERHMNQHRKYVLTSLFGLKGLLLYYWQNIGFLIFDLTREILSLTEKRNKF